MSHTVVGIFDSASEAQTAVNQLQQNGFNEENIDYTPGKTGSYSESANTHEDDNENGITRFFKNLFGDDDESTRYSRVAENGYVVSVYTTSEEEADNARNIMDQYGAVDVDEKDREYMSKNMTGTDSDSITNEGRKIPIIEEKMQVGKKVVETGGVRLRSRIIEKPVEETIRLRKEHVTVERNKVNRPVNDTDFFDFKEGTTEFKEHAEVPVVSKKAEVVEEVSLDKTVDHQDETIRDKVRRTEVDVEDLDKDDNRRNNL